MDIIYETFGIVNRELSDVKHKWNNSGNIFLMNFREWLDLEIKKRNWTRARLAKEAGFSEAAISLMFGGKREPGIDMCKAISEIFEMPLENVYRKAGFLPKESVITDIELEMLHVFNKMTKEEQEDHIAQGRFVIKRRNERKKDNEKRQQSRSEVDRAAHVMDPDESDRTS